MPERARTFSEVLNSNNSKDSGLKALATLGAFSVDVVGTWVNLLPSAQVWWLKPLAIVAINAPLGLALIYQAARTLKQQDSEDLRESRQRRAQQSWDRFDRLRPL